MAQRSKFTGALSQLRAAKEPVPAEEAPTLPEAEPATGKGRGRPRGKRSDTSYKPTTLLLRKDTKSKAMRQLEDDGSDLDLSDLVEELLADWLKRKS